MTRTENAELGIHIPNVAVTDHHNIANSINAKFVSVSSSIPPLDTSKLAAYLPSREPLPYLQPWEVYAQLNKIKPSVVQIAYHLSLFVNLRMSEVFH